MTRPCPRSCRLVRGPAPTRVHTLSLHDALPISSPSGSDAPADLTVGDSGDLDPAELFGAPHAALGLLGVAVAALALRHRAAPRSEEHTSELQSHSDLVCRLLLEKKNKKASRPTP